MRPSLLIHILQYEEILVEWVSCDGQSPTSFEAYGKGTLDEAAAAIQGRDVHVFISSADIVLSSGSVPSKQNQQIALALPYALEDQFIEDVETLHFATGQRNSDGLIPCAVISHTRMAYWLALLDNHGIEATGIYPSVLFLPWKDNLWTLTNRHGVVLIRTGPFSGFCCPEGHAAQLVDHRPPEASDKKLCYIRFSDDPGNSCPFSVDDRPEETYSLEHFDHHFIEEIGNAFSDRKTINLLQGRYSRNNQWLMLWTHLRPAVALSCLLITLIFANGFSKWWALKQRTQSQTDEISQIYRKAFPKDRRIINPRVQMQRHLDELGNHSASDLGSWFLGTLSEAAPILSSTKGISLERLTYKNEAISLRLDLPDLASIDRLKNRLVSLPDLDVEVITATANRGRVSTNLLIKPKNG